jgi:phenylalanyl-tRNA synthetase beta chain
MRVPLAWLRDYVDLPDTSETIAAKLATLGFPVDGIETRPVITGVVAGTIVACAKHPNADRLQVCTLDIGASATLTIATAATNVAQNQIVPVAVIGAQLPKLTIEPRKMRGIESQGMLCSPDELGLPAEWFEDGIMQLDAGTPNGTDVVAHFGLHLPILDVEVTANRGDALSIVGIARELAAALGTPLRFPPLWTAPAAAAADPSDVRVTLESLDVRRYIAQRVSNVTVRPGTAAQRVRLALAGQRPISNLVDISNFVMLELGQPLHFFDFEKIGGHHIIVRDARPGERLTTLDGVERELDATALLIADDVQATGLAGLMGGLVSEVSDSTREIVIESANFSGPRVRRMSVKLGLRTEASTRNEKNLPPALTGIAAARAAYLLTAEGASVAAPHSYGKPLEPPLVVGLAQSDVRRLLGFDITVAELRHALEALGFTVDPLGGGDDARFAVTVPAWRSDVAIAPDLVEEIARIIGYDRVRGELPPLAPHDLDSAAFDRVMLIAQTLAGLGYAECLTLSLQPGGVAERWRALGLDVPPCVEIRNPLSEDQRWMRFSMLPALLDHAARERAQRPLRTFEIGHVFTDAPDAPHETNVVTIVSAVRPVPDQPAWRDAAFGATASDVRALVRRVTGADARLEPARFTGLHPGKTARVLAGEAPVGYVGTVDPRLARAHELPDDVIAAVLFIDALPAHVVRRAIPLLKFPAVERDLAVIVDPAVSAAALTATARAATPLARQADVFDEYRGPQIGADKKSLALRIVLQRDDGTLTDAEADAAMHAIAEALRRAHGATLRG